MRNFLIFTLSTFFGLIAILVFFSFSLSKTPRQLITPTPVQDAFIKEASFSAELPPNLSLKAKITALTGDVFWQSRAATEGAKIFDRRVIQQGETIKTGDNGQTTVEFPNIAIVTLFEKGELNFAQTLPLNLVFVQKKGSVDYKKLETVPLSIRALHLLIDEDSGEIGVAVDTDKNTVAVNSQEGSVTLAFNDSQNITKVIQIPQGKQYFFDDDKKSGAFKISQ